jgi:hypothetical protein
MRSLATGLLVLFATLSVAEGGLLRPCQCGTGQVPDCGACPSSRVPAPAPTCSHCVADRAAGRAADGDTPDPTDSPGICPGPREPYVAPDAAPGLWGQAPAFLDRPVADAPLPPQVPHALARWPADVPRHVPWRLAPEGLAVFLT